MKITKEKAYSLKINVDDQTLKLDITHRIKKREHSFNVYLACNK